MSQIQSMGDSKLPLFPDHSQTEIQSSLSYKYLPFQSIQLDTLESGSTGRESPDVTPHNIGLVSPTSGHIDRKP
jgi:hypothetical protein